MKRFEYIVLSVIYYAGCVQIKVMEWWFTLKFILKNHRRPHKMSEEEFEELKQFMYKLWESERKQKNDIEE